MRSEFHGGLAGRPERAGPDGSGEMPATGGFPVSDERFQSAVIARLMRSAVLQMTRSFRVEPERRPGHA